MWRAFFLAIGVFVVILGVECLGVEKVCLKIRDDPPQAMPWDFAEPRLGPPTQVVPPPGHRGAYWLRVP